MATFTQTIGPTPFGIFDSDSEFQTDADKIYLFVKRRLGDDVVSVALPKKTIWACFEEATLEYNKIVNDFQVINNYDNILGLSTGTNIQNKYPKATLDYLLRKAEPYSSEAGYGGPNKHISGSINLVAGKQDYDLNVDLVDPATETPLFQLQASGSQTNMKIMDIYHFSPMAAYRFFDSTSAINFLNNEFSFESFTPETIFYVLPVFEDLLRAGQMQVSQRVRRSNYAYKIRGTDIRIFPTPTGNFPKKLWIRVMYAGNPYSPSYNDDTIDGSISNPANIPYTNIEYSKINSMGKTWIKKYTLALCKETLGYIRGKYSSGIPIPTGEVQLNYGDLLSHGREDMDKLVEAFKEQLDDLKDTAIIESTANNTENLMKQLRGIPMPSGYFIVPG